MNIFDKCAADKRMESARKLGIYPYFHEIESAQDKIVSFNGRKIMMLGSNNYLGLTNDERVKAAAISAVQKYGSGCSGSRFLNGTLDLHVELERKMADFLGKESCIIVSTGFQTNLAAISSICGRNDIIIADSRNHASLVDGARLSFSKVFKYEHGNMEDLDKKLSVAAAQNKGLIVVTDGVFSMEGEICNLPEITRLCAKYGAKILIDDAHALGVIGERGGGTAEYYGLTDKVDLITGTFSKSLASLGGFIAGDSEVIDYMRHHARPFIFSASIPPAQAMAALKALEILQAEPWRVERLHQITKFMKNEFIKRKINILESGNDLVPIIPIMTGTTMKTLFMAKLIMNEGVYVNPVLSPAVPEGSCLLRSSYTATEDENFLLEAAERIKRAFDKFDAEGFPSELIDSKCFSSV